MKQKSGSGCHSPWHSTSLHCPLTARSIANMSSSAFSLFAIYKSFLYSFLLLPIGFKIYHLPSFLKGWPYSSHCYFCYQVQTGSTGSYSNWFPLHQNITNCQSYLTRKYGPDFAENDSLLNLQKSHYQNYCKFNLLSV